MIETKVAEIVDETRFVLAAGKAQGVRAGMDFIIYALGPEVFDPETKESLGTLEIVKGKVKVYHVQDRLSHARTRSVSVQKPFLPFAVFPSHVTETVHERLPVEAKSGEYDQMLRVRVGDRARSVEVEAEVAPDAVSA